MKQIMIIAILALAFLIPSQTQVFAIHEGTTTISNKPTQLIDNCKSANPKETCISTVAANGTIIVIPGTPPPVKQPLMIDEVNGGYETGEEEEWTDEGDSDEVPRQSSGDNNNNNNNNDNPRDDPDCWYGDLYICDENGKCDTENVDCVTECADGSSVTTGEECPGDDKSDAPSEEEDNRDGPNEEETANCGGEPCTPTEKEDSWVDDKTEEEEGTMEEEEEEQCFENIDGALGDPVPC